jgi:hypothetical protein
MQVNRKKGKKIEETGNRPEEKKWEEEVLKLRLTVTGWWLEPGLRGDPQPVI